MTAKSILRKICTWSWLKLSMAAASALSQALATFARRVFPASVISGIRVRRSRGVAAAHDEAGPFEPSARCSLRISAHSSTMSTLSPGSPLEPEDSPEGATFQPPLKGQFSTVADTPNAGRCNGDDERDEWRATQTHQGSTPDCTK
jgi:hypothetical protein